LARIGGAARATVVCRTPQDAARAPPYSCQPVAAVVGGQVYLRALVHLEAEGGAGQPDFSLFVIAPAGSDLTPVLARLSEALARQPWQLSVRRLKDGLLAYCDRRPSPLDRGYRETLTVRLDWEDGDFLQREIGQLRFAEVVVSTTIYTNRLNTSSPLDWHLPTPEQEQTYLRTLAASLRGAMASGCGGSAPKWLDSATLSCGVKVQAAVNAPRAPDQPGCGSPASGNRYGQSDPAPKGNAAGSGVRKVWRCR
jgi:hypothetical protein